jgi:thioredoxin-like negative regulator of GroEL
MTATGKRTDNSQPSVAREHAFRSMPAGATAESRRPTKRPRLVFFYSHASGRCRRVEGFVAQVLQRRANHDTFDVMRVEAGDRPDLHKRFRVETLPTLLVIEDNRVRGRLADPGGCAEIERFLAPWLR